MVSSVPSFTQWILTTILILSSLGILIFRKPVHASLSFLLTLLTLATLYLQLEAQFIAVMQILVYAGAILVIFLFVLILFQDAHQQIDRFAPQSTPTFLIAAAIAFLFAFAFLGKQWSPLLPATKGLPEKFGYVETLGRALYIDFFFPFEAVVALFLIALVGALYIGKRGNS